MQIITRYNADTEVSYTIIEEDGDENLSQIEKGKILYYHCSPVCPFFHSFISHLKNTEYVACYQYYLKHIDPVIPPESVL